MSYNWQPRFFGFNNGNLKTGLVGAYWQQILQQNALENAGAELRLRNFVQPTLLIGAYQDSTTTIQPAAITAVDTGTSQVSLLTESADLPTPAAPAAATVGVASAQAVAARTGRRYACLVNTSGNWIYLGIGANAAVVGSGIALSPNGGSYEMTAAAGNMHDLAINAIASAAGSNLAIQEA